MVQINEDNSIYATRGDSWRIELDIDADGWSWGINPGDIFRFTVMQKNNVSEIFLQKDFEYDGDAEPRSVSVSLDFYGDETKIGEAISKPKDYWYEIEHLEKQGDETVVSVHTLIGYDEDGAKVLKLFPEAEYGA